MERILDSDWLAAMVVEAYTDKRYELGAALARLCVQAARMERGRELVPAPVFDKVREEREQPLCQHPNHPNFPDDCLFPKPIMPVEATQRAAEVVSVEDSTSVLPTYSARCVALIGPDFAVPCHGGLSWVETVNGRPLRGWRHVDGRQDHAAIAETIGAEVHR